MAKPAAPPPPPHRAKGEVREERSRGKYSSHFIIIIIFFGAANRGYREMMRKTRKGYERVVCFWGGAGGGLRVTVTVLVLLWIGDEGCGLDVKVKIFWLCFGFALVEG